MDHERKIFVTLSAILVGLGTLIVYSASITAWPVEFEQVTLSRHLAYLGLAAVAGVASGLVPAGRWSRLAPWLFGLTLLLLGLVLVPSVGTEVNGARRWLRCGPLSLQPSELAKITLPLMLCVLVIRRRDRLSEWWGGTVPVVWPALVAVPLVLFEPDLGTAVFLGGVSLLVLFLGGWPWRHLATAGTLAVLAVVSVAGMRGYQAERLRGFVAAWRDVEQAPYQLKQSLLALGSGGPTGAGLGHGRQKLGFLPEAHTDFAFAVVGEELGLVGTLAVAGLWIAVYVVGLRLLRRLPRDGFAFLAGVVLLTQLVIQAMGNVAVVTGLVPTKGLPHPLLSYGGSSLVVSIVTLGLVISMSRSTPSTVIPLD